MRLARQTPDHTRIRRDFVKLTTLEERAPQLIKLPISVGGVPILGPVLTPLVGPGPAPTPAPTPGPNPTPTPPSQPPSTPPSGGNNGNGGGNGNGGSSTPHGGNNGGNNGGNPHNGGGSDGNTSGSGTGTSSSPQPTNGSGNSGGSGTGNDPNSQNGSSPTAGNGQNLSTDPNGTGPVANAGENPNHAAGSASGGSGSSIHSGIVTASGNNGANPTSLSNPTNTDNSGGTNGALPQDTAATSKGMSTGAIAAIAVIVSLLFLALLILLIRRRYISRRSERRLRWWSRAGANGAYGDANSPPPSNRSRASVRSSFATTVDHGLSPRLTVDFGAIPPLPPMAEIRGGDNAPLFGQQAPIVSTSVLVSIDSPKMENRTSLRSVDSNHSDSQYLVVPNSANLLDGPSTPMSVRPFSPSESFSFPKPPSKQTQSGDWSSTRPTSSGTVNTALTSHTVVPATPALPANPFADPAQASAEFAEVESVNRPFIPTRDDELSVETGDSVKVLQLFDDGWALVEKLPPFETVLENAKNGVQTVGVRGLIPIDCFRAPGQDLPSFFSERRVSVPYQGIEDEHAVMAT